MKANELRIGNYVNHSSFGNYSVKKSHFNNMRIQFSKPIPLTEEWLLKFGFEKMQNYRKVRRGESKYSWYMGNTLMFDLEKYDNNDYFSVCFKYMKNAKFIIYVHELQNLYFALTNEELTKI